MSGEGRPATQIEAKFIEAICKLNDERHLARYETRQAIGKIFNDVLDLLIEAGECHGDTLWRHDGETIIEALIGLSEKYDMAVTEMLKRRLEDDWDGTGKWQPRLNG